MSKFHDWSQTLRQCPILYDSSMTNFIFPSPCGNSGNEWEFQVCHPSPWMLSSGMMCVQLAMQYSSVNSPLWKTRHCTHALFTSHFPGQVWNGTDERKKSSKGKFVLKGKMYYDGKDLKVLNRKYLRNVSSKVLRISN